MNVTEFLAGLQNASNVTVILKDLDTEITIADFRASSYSSLDDAIEAREIRRWTIVSATKIEVVLAASGTGTP